MVAKITVEIPYWALTFDKKKLGQTLRSAGAELAAYARSLIRGSHGSGKHGASLPGQPPANQSGALARSIKTKMLKKRGDDVGVQVRDMVPYALALETGAFGGGRVAGSGNTKRSHIKRSGEMRKAAAQARGEKREMAPRPFLSTAMEDRASSISARIRASVIDGIEFKRSKPSKR